MFLTSFGWCVVLQWRLKLVADIANKHWAFYTIDIARTVGPWCHIGMNARQTFALVLCGMVVLLAPFRAHAQQRPEPMVQRPLRILGELGAGAAVMALGTAWGLSDKETTGGIIFYSSIALSPLAVWGAGSALDGDGGLGWTYLGWLAGAAVGLPLGVTNLCESQGTDGADCDPSFAFVALSTGLPLLGSIIAYEASSTASRRQTEWDKEHTQRPAGSSVQLAPSITLTGFLLHAVGRF